VDGARPNLAAMARMDSPEPSPIRISTRSSKLNRLGLGGRNCSLRITPPSGPNTLPTAPTETLTSPAT
jgi:hypothetical protein